MLFDGHPLGPLDLEHIGYLPEERGLYPKMRVGEQIIFLARLKGLSKPLATERARSQLERLGAANWWDKATSELSKGMQQKVQFICALLHDPDLLILDEPFSGFDPVNAELLKQELLRLKALGKTIILSTHDMHRAEELCDDIALINQAQIVLSGETSSLRRAHSSNLIRVTYEGLLPVTLATSLDVQEHQALDRGGHFTLHLPPGHSLQQLIAELPPELELSQVERIQPSLGELFLKAVQSPLDPSQSIPL